MSESRIKISPDGSLRLPQDLMEKLGWKTGSYLEAVLDGDGVRLRHVEVDLFAEAQRKPEADAFEKILEKQRKSQADAFKTFEERVKKGEIPEVRPEDRPEFWR